MEIPIYTALVTQLATNLVLILFSIYILYLVTSLIFKVRKGKEIDKRKMIKKILIYSLILIGIFTLINIFFQYDPFNIIENPLWFDTVKPV